MKWVQRTATSRSNPKRFADHPVFPWAILQNLLLPGRLLTSNAGVLMAPY